MTDSQAIDQIYGRLLEISNGSDFNFDRFRGAWGKKNDDNYQSMFINFVEQLRRMAKELPIKFYEGKFWIFDGKIYVAIREELVETAYFLWLEHTRIACMITYKMVCKKYFLDIIRYYNILHPRADIVAFKNGVLDLTDFRFHEFSPNFHVTYYHPYVYDEKAKCNKWLNFLREVLPDKNSRLILQMFLGLGLMERGTVYNPYEGKNSAKIELCLILIGAGANGKSTIYDTALGVFGKERISGLDYDDLTAQGDEGMRARTLLHDAIFNWSSDSDQRTFGRKRTGVFKRLVSGESVTMRRIGEDVKENYHIPFLIFNLNELPYADDQSLGFIRRLQFISFEYVVPKEKQNPALSRELTVEYPGIFNWIVRGCKELKRRKFVFPSSEGSRRQVLLAQLHINPIISWVNCYRMRWEPMAAGELGAWVSAKDMLVSLEQFCYDNNVEMPSKQKFGQTMARIGRGFTKKLINGTTKYQVFGCDPDHLIDHFIIQDADMEIEYVEESGTFIGEDD